jgi:hypothetical protein
LEDTVPVVDPDWTTVHAANRALADSVLLTLTAWPVRYGSPEFHALPAAHPDRAEAMRRAAEAWAAWWQPDAVATRRAADADRIDRATTARLRAASHDIAAAARATGTRPGPTWQDLHRRRYPWLYPPTTGEQPAAS